MTESLPSPLGGPPPAEVVLSRSPLVSVIMQVRFSSVLRIDSTEGVAPLQEQLRADYPLLEHTAGQQIQFDLGQGTAGVRPIVTNLWRFSAADRSLAVVLTSDTVTFEIHRYSGREDTLSRWANVISRVEDVFSPGLVLRRGVRYVNRIHEDSLAQLSEWVSPNLVGVAQPEIREFVTQAMSEAFMTVEEGRTLLRWGILPPNSTIDPSLLTPVPTPSWILDIDVSSDEQETFSGVSLNAQFDAFSKRAYSLFCYALTPIGLTHFGSEL